MRALLPHTLLFATLLAGTAATQTCSDYDVADPSELQKLRVAQGFRPYQVSVRQTASGPRYELLWTKNSTRWSSLLDQSGSAFSARFTELNRAGFRPVTLDAHGDYPNERLHDVWVMDRANISWHLRPRLTATELTTWHRTYSSTGFALFSLGCAGTGSRLRYQAIWYKQAGLDTIYRTGMSFADLSSYLRANPDRYVISLCTDRTGTRFGAVLRKSPTADRINLLNWTLPRLVSETAKQSRNGYRPLAVVGFQAGSKQRYCACLSAAGKLKLVRTTGLGVSSLSRFDTAMRRYMSENKISQGALAVTKDNRLVLARGYTYGPFSARLTHPHSVFRLASVSKPLTAVGVLELIEQKKISIDQKIGTILDMRRWTDARARNVTIRQLLQHWGGWEDGIMFKPYSVTNSAASVLSYARGRMLQQAPGSSYIYSNFGYFLLGQIIEKVTGEKYEDYMQREVFLPIGASSFRVTDSARGKQIPGEVDYDHPVLKTDQTIPYRSTNPQVEWPYGGFNIRTMAAHGGFAASAVDVARFAAAFQDPNRSPLLRRSTIDLMFSRPPATNARAYYGAGWSVRRDTSNKIVSYSHAGSLPGTYTLVWRIADGYSITALFNKRDYNGTTSNDDKIWNYLANAFTNTTSWPTHDLFPKFTGVFHRLPGCKGSRGVPYIRPQAGSRTVVGYPFTLEAASLGTSRAETPLLYLGTLRKLPISLTALGMRGCYLNIHPFVALPLANAGGHALFRGCLPNDSGLVGKRLWMQALVVNPSTYPTGAATSRAAGVQIGG